MEKEKKQLGVAFIVVLVMENFFGILKQEIYYGKVYYGLSVYTVMVQLQVIITKSTSRKYLVLKQRFTLYTQDSR